MRNKEQLIGELVFDPRYGTDLRVTGFRFDGKVSLTDDETGRNTAMTLQDVIALENESEALGKVTRSDRVTCPVCERWNVVDHDHFWLEDNYVVEIDEPAPVDLSEKDRARRMRVWVELFGTGDAA